MQVLFLLFFILPSVFGGSLCPPRSDIRPCICLNRPIGKKKMETMMICHNLASAESLTAIGGALEKMEIDKFLLYDSFWSNELRSQNQRVGVNTLSGYRIGEIQVVDTLMTGFGCPTEFNCRVAYVKRYTSINSTMHDRTTCNNNGPTVATWVSCSERLQHLEIYNGLPPSGTLRPEFFPQTMSNLEVLNLTHNSIARIEKRTFDIKTFPVLHTLDLSHNILRDVKNTFSTPLELRHLDLSYNPLRVVLDLSILPHLQSLKLSNTNIVYLLENEWQNLPKGLRHIDFSSNKLLCNCGLKWVNSTFHINTNLMGTCAEPPQVLNMKLRRASRLLNERCDEKDNISASRIVKKGSKPA